MFAYCKEKGLDVIKPFYEVASGLDATKRTVFLNVMDFVLDPANRISHVVFHDLSRFSRSKSDPYTYLKLLQEHDIIIHSAHNKTNSDDDNELLWDIHIIFNHEYSKTISQLTIRGQSDSVRMGNDISPVASYGYEKYYVEEGGRRRPRWRPHPEHSKVVLTIFTMRDQKFLPMAICNHLNGLGIPAPKGGLWTTGTIINILRNITYLGYSQVGKNPTSVFPKHRRRRELVQNPNAHPAIVPEELFNRVQKLMPKKPRAQREPPRSHDSPNPISDRVKCGNRNHKLANMVVTNPKNGAKKLKCSVKKNSGVRYCDTPDVELDDFLNTLGGALKERLSVPAIIKEQLETLVKNSGKAIKQEKDRQAAITKRSKEIDQAKAKLMKGLEEAEEEFPENVSDFNKALSDLNKEKRQLEQQREDIDAESSELMAFLADPEGLMEALSELGNQIDPEDLAVTSRFLQSFIKRVDICGDEATMYYSMPLTNTVETPDGFRTSVPIKREGSEILLEQFAPSYPSPSPSPSPSPFPLSLLPVLTPCLPDSSRPKCGFHLGFGLGIDILDENHFRHGYNYFAATWCGEWPCLEVILTLSDRQWKLIEPILPSGPGKPGRNGNDNRMSLEGMIWICRTGAPWRDLPEVFGKWGTMYRQFRRWAATGVFDSIFDEIGDELHMQSAIADGRPASFDPGPHFVVATTNAACLK